MTTSFPVPVYKHLAVGTGVLAAANADDAVDDAVVAGVDGADDNGAGAR